MAYYSFLCSLQQLLLIRFMTINVKETATHWMPGPTQEVNPLIMAPRTYVFSDVRQTTPVESPDAADKRRMPGWKRVLDLTLIALTYPIWLPLMLLVMVAIKISSPGPIFYRQERVGFRGRSFMIFKFRSMKVHAQTSWHELHFRAANARRSTDDETGRW